MNETNFTLFQNTVEGIEIIIYPRKNAMVMRDLLEAAVQILQAMKNHGGRNAMRGWKN